MSLDLTKNEEKAISNQPSQPKQIKAWEELSEKQKNAIIALSLSNSIREASKKYKAMTGYSLSDFWSHVYPTIKETWKEYISNIPDKALMMLKGGSLKAVKELIDEVDHYDVEIRHKASKVIVEGVVLKKESDNKNPNINIPIQINVDKYIEE